MNKSKKKKKGGEGENKKKNCWTQICKLHTKLTKFEYKFCNQIGIFSPTTISWYFFTNSNYYNVIQ